ncbi:hypothetical protein B0T25DRAFT_574755 [Lasiosphaeria hispida]|uniref:Fungal calcium binding protein domain-containing protein n=1 Tax=Lasiosphaeria hispida TaxID=260671 RepID=A0AAJ0M7P4_9PEZI|nr:hypothetical protein B0T25DRAFT_574755 [Lasiosphaeria hispida]
MQLSIFATLLAALAVPSSAAPSTPSAGMEVEARDAEFSVNEAEIFTFAVAASCSILNCAKVLGQGVCIANALLTKKQDALEKCGDRKQLCKCSGCITGLDDFLVSIHFCLVV